MLIPLQTIGLAAGITIFVVMLALGLAIPVDRLAYLWHHPLPLLRGALAALIVVPLLALATVVAIDLPHPTQVGIMLMAISPGAPIALRRALDAGAHGPFAPCLQLVLVGLAVFTVPVSLELLDLLYFGDARADPLLIARQVLLSQLLPLSLGIGLRAALPAQAQRMGPWLARAGNLLFAGLAILLIASAWRTAVSVGVAPILCALGLTAAALGAGFLLGRPDPETQPAMAIESAMRNPGLALLLASANDAAPGVIAMIIAYLLASAVVVMGYIAMQRRAGAARLGVK